MQPKNIKVTPFLTVVNIDRDKLVVCDTRSSTTPVFIFPPQSVSDLEITNRDLLSLSLKKFVEEHRLTPGHLILVLSPNVYFDRDLSASSPKDREFETQQFLETIPFASISSRVFKVGTGLRLVAINRDLYESIKSVFEQLNFSVTAVVPSFVVNSFGVKDNFNIEACRLILKKSDYVIANNFLTPDEKVSFSKGSRSFLNRNPLVVILLLLTGLGFLGFAGYLTLRRPAPKPRPKVSAPVVVPSVISQAPSTPSATPAPAELKVRILNGSGVSGLASKFQKQIEDLGFTDITVGNSSVSAQQTILVYSSRVPVSYRELVGIKVRDYFTGVTVRENPEDVFDITVIAGKAK